MLKKKLLIPDWDARVILPEVSLDALRQKNIQLIILDVDNTLLSGKAEMLTANANKWIVEASEKFKIHLFSNNPSLSRIEKVAKLYDLDFTNNAGKPSRKKLIKVLDKTDLQLENIAIIGDRIFTDILVGNRIGLYTVLVKPITKEGKESKYKTVQKAERLFSKLLTGDL